MKYLLTLYGDESRLADLTPEQQARRACSRWDAYTQAAIDAGVHLGGEGLQPSATATTLRIARTASRSSPTARSPRPRSSSAATTCSTARTSTRRSPGRKRIPMPGRHGRGAAGDGLRRRGLASCTRNEAEARRVERLRGGVDRLFRRGVGAGGRHPDPRPRRLRPRRGGGAGRVRRRARALAARRRAGQPGRLDRDARPATAPSTASAATRRSRTSCASWRR